MRAVLEQTRATRFSGETSQRIPSQMSSRTCRSRASGSINCACSATSGARYAAGTRSRVCAVSTTWLGIESKPAKDPATLAAIAIPSAIRWKPRKRDDHPDLELANQKQNKKRAEGIDPKGTIPRRPGSVSLGRASHKPSGRSSTNLLTSQARVRLSLQCFFWK